MLLNFNCRKISTSFQNVCHLIIKRNAVKTAFKMDRAYFRHVDGEPTFSATFRYKNVEKGIDKLFNFSRRLDEPCSTFLTRINGNIEKGLTKKKKKKVQDTLEPVEIKSFFSKDSTEMPFEVPCGDILKASNVILNIDEQQWIVEINAPWIENLSLPKSIMVNFPIFITKFEGLFVDRTLSDWTWFKGKSRGGPWIECSRDVVFTPTSQDIGHYIRVVCVPKNAEDRCGPPQEAISTVIVEAGPGDLPFEARHAFTKTRVEDNGFRIVSYNILADLYVDQEYSRTVLFGYCPPYALELSYRRQLLFKEILGYNSDIFCLQEVDSKVFRHDLVPILTPLGFQGEFSQKGETSAEGTAMLFNSNKFKLCRSWRLVLGEILKTEPIFADIWQKICENKELVDRVTQVPTTLQILLLESKVVPNQLLVLANTHLYFHPDADHIRLLQAVMIVRYLEDVLKNTKAEFTGKDVSLVLCGDFNSVPECGIYELVTTGKVGEDNIDWKSKESEAITGVSHSHPLQLASACGTPEYTNYTVGFKACLDYIFYQQDHLRVNQVVPLPSEKELATHGGIPSVTFPSDHVALVCDLVWKNS